MWHSPINNNIVQHQGGWVQMVIQEGRNLWSLPPLDHTKLTRDLKFEPNDPDTIPNRTSKICSPESGFGTRIDLNRAIPGLNFFIKCLFLHDKYIGPNISWLEIDPNWSSLNLNRTYLKCNLTRNMNRSKLNPIHTRTEWLICQVYSPSFTTMWQPSLMITLVIYNNKHYDLW